MNLMLSNRQVVSRTLPFFIYISFLSVNVPLENYVLAHALFDIRWLYACRIAMVTFCLWYFFHDYVELNFYKSLNLKTTAISVFIGLAVFLFWIMPYPNWAASLDKVSFNPLDQRQQIFMSLVVTRLLGAVIVVPIMEELFWRSFLMRWIDQRNFNVLNPNNISYYALFVTSIVFGISHHLWLVGILAGLAYGLLYQRTMNLWYPIVAHATTNLVLGIWVLHSGNWQYW